MVYAKCTNVYSQSEMNVEDERPADHRDYPWQVRSEIGCDPREVRLLEPRAWPIILTHISTKYIQLPKQNAD